MLRATSGGFRFPKVSPGGRIFRRVGKKLTLSSFALYSYLTAG